MKKKRFMTSTTCENAWCKLGFTLTRTSLTLRLTSGFTIWDHMCVRSGGGDWTRVHLYDSPECFMKMSMQLYAFKGYLVVNIVSWSCVHMHFRCFHFHKVLCIATLIRWGGWSSYLYMYRSFQNLTVETALKSVDFWAAVCKTVRPMLSHRCLSVCPVCLWRSCTVAKRLDISRWNLASR